MNVITSELKALEVCVFNWETIVSNDQAILYECLLTVINNVFYLSKSFSEHDIMYNKKSGGRFHANSSYVTRKTSSGSESIPMTKTQIGDQILATNPATNQPVFSEVVAWIGSDSTSKTVFHKIRMDGGQTLSVTPTHLLHTVSVERNSSTYSFVRDLAPGDFLLSPDPLQNGTLKRRKIRSIEKEISSGALAPLTSHGTVIVNNVSASCYASVRDPALAHSAFAPLRWWTQMRISFHNCEQKRRIPEGDHPYAMFLEKVSEFILPKGAPLKR